MNKTLKAFEGLISSYEVIDFSQKQRALLEKTAISVDADDALISRFREDCLSLQTDHGHEETCDPLLDSAHPAHALAETQRSLYPALVLLSSVKALKEAYRQSGISMQVLRDTLSDIPLWMDNCEEHFGYQGMLEYEWLSNHVKRRLFRLGRLEYIYTVSRVPAYFYRAKADSRLFVFLKEGMKIDAGGALSVDGTPTAFSDDGITVHGHLVDSLGNISVSPCTLNRDALALVLYPGAPVLDVHIPEGPPMAPEAIEASLNAAPPFFQKYCGVTDACAFTCGSWLMAPGLSKIIPGSNIASFQQRFYRVPYTLRDNQVLERVYGKEYSSWAHRPLQSRLQKGVYEWYQRGGNLRQMQGVILITQPD